MKILIGRLSKLDDQSQKMVLCIIELGAKSYGCLDPVTFKPHISSDVILKKVKDGIGTSRRSTKKEVSLNFHLVLI